MNHAPKHRRLAGALRPWDARYSRPGPIDTVIFGGIHPNSMIDYPGKLACVLFTAGCNFHCPYCHNPGLATNRVNPDESVDLDEAIALLSRRRLFLDGVVISGGEPTIHEDLLSVCQSIKRLGYPLKLDTNGSRPEVIERLLSEKVLDYIAMDIKTLPEQYAPLISGTVAPADIRRSIRMIRMSGIAHEFRTTCIHPLVSLETIMEIAALIDGADLYALQQFHAAGVLNPAFCIEKNRRFASQVMDLFRAAAAPRVKKCIIR